MVWLRDPKHCQAVIYILSLFSCSVLPTRLMLEPVSWGTSSPIWRSVAFSFIYVKVSHIYMLCENQSHLRMWRSHLYICEVNHVYITHFIFVPSKHSWKNACVFLKYSLIFCVSKMTGILSLASDCNYWKLGNGGGRVWLSLLQSVRVVVEIFWLSLLWVQAWSYGNGEVKG